MDVDDERAATRREAEPETGQTALRGPAIRETAVLLALKGRHPGALHYRAWYELLIAAGYRVAGKDPLAVFLTQLSRSPLVRKSTQAGVYEVNREAPGRLAARLSTLRAKLMQAAAGSHGGDLGDIRKRREALLNDIRHTERALEEAERVFGEGATDIAAADLRVAG